MAINSNFNVPQTGGSNMTFAIQSALAAYSDEAYTYARKLSGTGMIGTDAQINPDTETYIGQLRWFKPDVNNVNVASLSNAAEGTRTDINSNFATYIKTVRTHGARQINMETVVTQHDGLAKIARDFGETRAQDEHNAVLATLTGIAISEAKIGTGTGGLGGQTFTNPVGYGDTAGGSAANYGFYVDIGGSTSGGTPVAPAGGTPAGSSTTGNTGYNYALNGAQRANAFLQAIGMGFKDYEPDYLYMITSPAVYASLRSANLVEDTTVEDGMINLQTIFGGKFRLIMTRATQSMSSTDLTNVNTGSGVDIVGTNTTFLVKPGAMAMTSINVPYPVEVFRQAATYQGGGTTDIWYRWGYVLHPMGYSWTANVNNGNANAFVTNQGLGNQPEVGAASTTAPSLPANASNWSRVATSVLSLGILPVFHG